MDATLIETHKREALPSYKGFKASQPLNCWWAEHGVVLHSEFRDGNVPTGYQQLRVLKDCLAAAAATGVTKVYLPEPWVSHGSQDGDWITSKSLPRGIGSEGLFARLQSLGEDRPWTATCVWSGCTA